MKKTLKNLIPLLIWIVILIIGYVIYRSKALGYGEDTYKTFLAFQKILFHSGLFWVINILMLIQSILMNFSLKPKKVIFIVIGILTLICAIVFSTTMIRELDITQISYNELGMGWSILPYKVPCFIMSILSVVLTGYNIFRAVKEKNNKS